MMMMMMMMVLTLSGPAPPRPSLSSRRWRGSPRRPPPPSPQWPRPWCRWLARRWAWTSCSLFRMLLFRRWRSARTGPRLGSLEQKPAESEERHRNPEGSGAYSLFLFCHQNSENQQPKNRKEIHLAFHRRKIDQNQSITNFNCLSIFSLFVFNFRTLYFLSCNCWDVLLGRFGDNPAHVRVVSMSDGPIHHGIHSKALKPINDHLPHNQRFF